jgi:hypothetical protein
VLDEFNIGPHSTLVNAASAKKRNVFSAPAKATISLGTLLEK